MGFFKKKQPQELPPIAPPQEIEEVGSEEQEEEVESPEQEEEEPRLETRGRPVKVVAEEPEEDEEQKLITAIYEDGDVRLINHEQRLQAIEAALFRVKGSI